MTGEFSWTQLLWLLGALILVLPALPRLLRRRNALFFVAIWLALAVVLAMLYRLVGPLH